MLFFLCWVMVGLMTTGVRSMRGLAALSGVAGLVVLALMFVVTTPAWHGRDPGQRAAALADGVLTPGTWMTEPSAVLTAATAPQHGPALSPVRNQVARVPVPPVLIDAWPDPDTIRSPQQTAPRTTGSRSPPGF